MISLKSHMKLKSAKAAMNGPSTTGEVLVVPNDRGRAEEGAVGVGRRPVLQEVDYDQYPDDAQSIRCNYRDEPRPVSPAACLWHRAEKDPECFRLKCPRVNLGGIGNAV
jgi:hypothetical protein